MGESFLIEQLAKLRQTDQQQQYDRQQQDQELDSYVNIINEEERECLGHATVVFVTQFDIARRIVENYRI